MATDGDAGDPGMTPDQLPEPWRGLIAQLDEHRDHPARAWFVGICNGVHFEDDNAVSGLPAPWSIFRFRRGDRAAYIWEDEGWHVRPWQRTRGRVSNAVTRVETMRAALDLLRQGPRPWWRLWG